MSNPYSNEPMWTQPTPPVDTTRSPRRRKSVLFGVAGVFLGAFFMGACTATLGTHGEVDKANAELKARPTVTATASVTATATVTTTPKPAPTVTKTEKPKPAPTVTVTKTAKLSSGSSGGSSGGSSSSGGGSASGSYTQSSGSGGGGGCYPTSSSGNCYRAGEYCPHSDIGMTGSDASGDPIVCENNNGYRWEHA